MTFIIDDKTDIRPLLAKDVEAGRFGGALPRQTQIGELECAQVFADRVQLIPEAEWPERIREMTAKKLWVGDRVQFDPRAWNQGRLGYCWAYSLAQAVYAERIRSGQSAEILAPESLGEDVRWRNAGNYLDSALRYATRNGIARRKYVPQHEINPSRFDSQWLEDRKNFVPLEWWDLGGRNVWAETVTVLLSGGGAWIGLSWWSHAVYYAKLVLDGSRVGVWTPNSHGPGGDTILFGSRAVPSLGSFAIRSVTHQLVTDRSDR